MGCEQIIKMFFNMNLNLKLYHWQTSSYARHIGSDGLHTFILPLIDKFIEVYMGRYGRPEFRDGVTIDVKEFDDESIKELLKAYNSFLKNEVPKYLKESDTDLLNIRDELVSEINKTLYLFTLN